MRKKKRQVTLNIRLLGIQLLTLLPVFLLLIFVSYSMLRNLSGQIYDIRENEMNVVISRFDNEVRNIKADLSGLVEQYRGRMMEFRQDLGLMRFNVWSQLKEILQENGRIDFGYVKADNRVDVTYNRERCTYDRAAVIQDGLAGEEFTDKENYACYILETQTGTFFLMNVNEEILSFGILIDMAPVLDQLCHEEGVLETRDYFSDQEFQEPEILSVYSEETGFYLTCEIRQDSLNRAIPLRGRVLLVIALVSLILLPVQWMAVRRYVLEPLSRLKNAMEELKKGHLDYRLSRMEKTEEFSSISHGFNQMTDEIKNLKISVYERDMEKMRIENTNLRLQVNPHMLLNYLNMIYSLAKSKNYQCIEDISIHLSGYFRYALYNQKEFSTIREEMAFVSNYMEIQKIRFPDAFSFVFDVEEELLEEEVPTMLIQNFVENAIKYALNMEHTIDIIVIIRKREERLCVSIVDTGNGMDSEILESLQRGEAFEDYRGKHIGVWNCRKRLHMYYGDQAVLTISSRKGAGTQVWMEMPVRRAKEANKGGRMDESGDCG